MSPDRHQSERYRYTLPSMNALLADDSPYTTGVRGAIVEVEASPALLSNRAPDLNDLAPWITQDLKKDLERDLLWADQVMAQERNIQEIQGVQIEISEKGEVADGVIYLHVRYPSAAFTGYTPVNAAAKIFVRNSISLAEHARARVVIHHHRIDNPPLRINTLTAIRLDSCAELDIVEITDTGGWIGDTVLVGQRAGSKLKSTVIDLDNQFLRRNQFVLLKESGAACDLQGICLTDGDQQADNYIKVHHAGSGCSSRQLFKGVASESSTGVFTGHIYVSRDAQKSVAMQEIHTIVQSDQARIHTRPQLEIYADDVKCNHGATIGRLDEDALYYMRQRGIGLSAAKQLQLSGFAGEIVGQCGIEELQHTLSARIAERLAHTSHKL